MLKATVTNTASVTTLGPPLCCIARPVARATGETSDEGVDTEEQYPEGEEQLDPQRDADGREQDQGDRIARESEPLRDEPGAESDRRRRDGEDRGHPHRVGVQDDGADPAAEARYVS